MSRFGIAVVLVLVCLVLTSTAHAYINTPFITPASPRAGETLTVNVDSGVCDALVAEEGYPHVTVIGSDVRVVLFAVRYTDPELCNLPSGIGSLPFGSLPEGTYQITVDVFYTDLFGHPFTDTIGVLPLVVQAAAAAPIGAPTVTLLGLALLVALLGGAAIWKQRAVGRRV